MKFLKIVFLAPVFAMALCFGAAAAEFAPCKDASQFAELKGTLCATFSAPLRAPGKAVGDAADTVRLFVRKFPATGHAKGTLWLVAGGPGESGATSLYPFMATVRAAFPGFDILVPDHRGTGYSTRMCPKEEAEDTPGGMALAGAEWGTCWQHLNAAPDYARAFSVTNAAYDLASLIAQYDSKTPTYLYGVSYGTQLVLRTFVVAHPKVDGIILDSLVPPERSENWDLSHRSQGADAVGREVLDRCDAAPSCRKRFAVSAEESYRQLLAANDAAVLAQVPGRDLRVFFGGLLDFPGLRARIPALIAGLNKGDVSGLVAVKAALAKVGTAFARYPQSPSSIPLVSEISVSENDARPAMTKAEVTAEEHTLLFASSLPGLLVDPGLPLYRRDANFGVEPTSLPRTLVLQGTLDPKTPFEGARAHVAALARDNPVTLVAVKDAPHFVLAMAPNCFVQAAHSFARGGAVRAPACAVAHFRNGF